MKMIEIYQLTKTLEKLMAKMDRIIEQNDTLIAQKYPQPNIPYYPPYNPPVESPFTWPNYTNSVTCFHCGKDTGIPTILNMVIPPEGLKCPHCGKTAVYSISTTCQETFSTKAINSITE